MQKTTIDSTIVPKLREWFVANRGVKLWRNLEIGSAYGHEVFTPGDAEKPGWRYGEPRDMQPTDFDVEVFTPIESFRGRFKAHYWGPGVSEATERKAKRLCAKHGTDTSWRWQYDDLPGYVQVTIGRTTNQALNLL